MLVVLSYFVRMLLLIRLVLLMLLIDAWGVLFLVRVSVRFPFWCRLVILMRLRLMSWLMVLTWRVLFGPVSLRGILWLN